MLLGGQVMLVHTSSGSGDYNIFDVSNGQNPAPSLYISVTPIQRLCNTAGR